MKDVVEAKLKEFVTDSLYVTEAEDSLKKPHKKQE
jgi:hypothetical protein